MRWLLQGGESAARLNLILSATKISSEPTIDALHDHLVKGIGDAASCALNGVSMSNFNRALKTVNEMAGIIEAVKEHDWANSRISASHKSLNR